MYKQQWWKRSLRTMVHIRVHVASKKQDMRTGITNVP